MTAFLHNFPFFAIMVCMLCAIVCVVLKPRGAWRLMTCAVLVCAGLAGGTLGDLLSSGASYVYPLGHFPAPWCNELRAGVLEALTQCIFTLVMLFSLCGGRSHIRQDVEPEKVNLYCTMICLMQGAIQALIYTNDIFTAYVFIEISTIAAGGILMIREIGRTTLAAVRYMIMSLLGSGLFLIGVVLIYDLTGQLLIEYIAPACIELYRAGVYTVPLTVSVGLVTAGLAIKSGLFPFHFWMPDTYGFSTPASASILSGLVSKAYIFLLLKIYWRAVGLDIFDGTGIGNALFAFGLAAIIVGSVAAIRENDIRRMTAWSSAAQIGYIFVGFGLCSEAGFCAAVFHMYTHAVTKPLLFISSAGLSDVSGGKKDFSHLTGAGLRNRAAGIGFAVGALSMVGVPLFAGFVSKLLFAEASVMHVHKVLPTMIVLAVSTVLNAVYFLRTVIRIFRPEKTEEDCPLIDVPQGYRNTKGFLTAVCGFVLMNLSLGMASQTVYNLIRQGFSMFA